MTSLDGFQTNVELISLYMHENCIKKIDHLSTLVNLRILNLADNMITKVEGLESLVVLDTIYLARNQIGRGGLDDIKGLLECPSLSCVDI